MYEDLDIQRWEGEESNDLIDHPILRQLLIGAEREPCSDEREEIEDDSIPLPIEGVVFDADSSQLEAVRRVVDGENLVLEGPPGTGKSQTIANIISVSLEQGKKVLFVADKKAAIEVVERRLEKVGLGSFCLNLHDSSSQAKGQMYARLADRLELIRPRCFDQVQNKHITLRNNISQLTKNLDEYYFQLAHVINEPSTTTADILWSSLSIRDQFSELPGSIRKIKVPCALTISWEQSSSIDRHLKDLENLANELGLGSQGLKNHGMFGLNCTDSSFFSQQKIAELVAELCTIAREIQVHADSLKSFGCSRSTSFSQLGICYGLTEAFGENTDYLLLDALRRSEKRTLLGESLEKLLDFCPNLGEKKLNRGLLVKLNNSCECLLSYLATSGKDGAILDELLTEQENTVNFIPTFQSVLSLLRAFFPEKKLGESIDWAKILCDLSHILHCLEDKKEIVRPYLHKALWYEIGDQHWIILSEKVKQIKETYEELQLVFSPECFTSRKEVDDLCSEFFNTSVTNFFRPSWWKARSQLGKLIINHDEIKHKDGLRNLKKLQKWHEQDVEIRNDTGLCSLVGEVTNLNSLDLEPVLLAKEVHDELMSMTPDTWTMLQVQGITGEETVTLAHKLLGENAARILVHASEVVGSKYPFDNLLQIEKQISDQVSMLSRVIESLDVLGVDSEMKCESLNRLSALIEALMKVIASESLFEECTMADLIDVLALYDGTIKSVSKKTIDLFIENMAQSSKSETKSILVHLTELVRLLNEFKLSWCQLRELGELNEEELLGQSIKACTPDAVQKRLVCLEEALDDMTTWVSFQKTLRPVKESASPACVLVQTYLNEDRPFCNIAQTFRVLLTQSRAMDALQNSTVLQLDGNELKRIRSRFVLNERQYQELAVESVRSAVLSRPVWQGARIGRRGEWTGVELIKNELFKKKRRISQRGLIKRTLPSLLAMTPCFMMSPLTVAQYLAPEARVKFDLVLIDEASQMRPEEALSAIVRGSQLVVVGDSKQLPPTNFFTGIAEDEEMVDEDAIDNESILDMTGAIFSKHSLLWHYRSRHESLINFSNRYFYDGRLIVCPSPRSISELSGVHLIRVEGIYDKSLNHLEAEALVLKAIELMHSYPMMSMGIVAINGTQQSHINSLLYEVRCNDPEVNEYLEGWEERSERCFVKNLENVQGDERDIILISTVYGPMEPGGRVLRRFGPINSDTGHRRLNVLFTRARDCMYVFTSLKPTDICPPDLDAPSAGVEAFAQFLEFAGSGIQASPSSWRRDLGKREGPESPFEQNVGDMLVSAGYEVEYQVGQSGFRIDIGLRHSSFPYGHIAGIECDGAAYHSSMSARDRDRLRQDILENHGWDIYRIWSTDWFNNPRRERAKLLDWLQERLKKLASASKLEPE